SFSLRLRRLYIHSFPTRRSSDLDDILMGLYEAHPDVVCFSCYLWNIQYVEQVITELAKVLPDTQIWQDLRKLCDDLLHILDVPQDRKSTRLNSSHVSISYAVFC